MFRVSLKVARVAEVVEALRLHLACSCSLSDVAGSGFETVNSGFLFNLQSFHLYVVESVR